MIENISPINIDPVNKNQKKIWLLAGLVAATLIIVLVLVFSFIQSNKKQATDNEVKNALQQLNTEQLVKEKVLPPERQGVINLTSDKKEVAVGDEFKVSIILDTQGANIVLAKAVVGFDDKALSFSGKNNIADTKNSVLNMGIVNEVKANSLEVTRGKPGDTDYQDSDDGYTGSNGILAVLTFKALQAGSVEVKLTPGQTKMFLDNGLATEMKLTLNNLTLNIK
ncbi:MAG TPA: cohesin domain-containing protein [bacterium]|nr:cohesin domain-containing protein [bacterium]